MVKKNVLAFDLGASSGRAIVGQYCDGSFEMKEVHRFANEAFEQEGTLYWDIDYLLSQIIDGIKLASEQYEIDSLGVDTWGVDYGLLDADGELLRTPIHYRDKRTRGMIKRLTQKMSLSALYQRTGNQIMEINTLFQLLAEKEYASEVLEKAETLLFMPDLLNYLLTGKKLAEKSIASTSQLINASSGEWDVELLEALGLPSKILPPLVSAGHFVGQIKESLDLPPIDVINVCAHDTASAVVSVPCNQEFLFVSCGTWSLVGTELKQPVINEKAFRYSLTNERGINDTTRFLKNCTGLWIIQEVKRQLKVLGRDYSYEELANLAYEAPAFQCLIDTDDNQFSEPGQMIEKIQQYARETQQPVPQTDGELVRCVYESLAMKYKYTFLEITDAVEHEFDTINIVGGGSQAQILCQMVADAANIRVSAGPVEATAIGNIAVQLMAQGVFKTIEEVREWVKDCSDVEFYFPTKEQAKRWDEQFTKYQQLLRTN